MNLSDYYQPEIMSLNDPSYTPLPPQCLSNFHPRLLESFQDRVSRYKGPGTLTVKFEPGNPHREAEQGCYSLWFNEPDISIGDVWAAWDATRMTEGD